MVQQFPQATQNLLRCIDCPCFTEENREAVQQFLSKFAIHITQQFFEEEHVNETTLNLEDMPEEKKV
jgi:hypothetical protein